MRIEIFTDADHCDCETCGSSYASGGRVLIDGVTVVDLPAIAACFDGQDHDVEALLVKALEAMGHVVLIDSGVL